MKGHEQQTGVAREVVIVSNESSRDAHMSLYHYAEDRYFIADTDLLGSIVRLTDGASRLHISVSWADIIRIATWKSDPERGDIFVLLRKAGIQGEELHPFGNSAAGDIFPWLYYGKKMDVLRKICRSAKTNVESRIRNKETRVYCHLVSEITNSIVASSL